MLLLSLWQAPMPWLHAHGTNEHEDANENTLTRHITEFHDNESADSVAELGWHVHLVLPWCPAHRDPCSPERSQQHDSETGHFQFGLNVGMMPSASTTAIFDALASNGSLLQILAIDVPLATTGTHCPRVFCFGQQECAHFLGTYGDSIAICDLLSSRVC